jgi:type I restriction enzyme S subunit
MEKLKNIPSLRFPEFDGEWENTKLGKVAKFSKGKGISKSDITEDGINECIRYGELYTRYGEVIQDIYSKTDFNINSAVISEANDVIIPASGETQIDIATASCVIKSGVILGGDLNIIKTNKNGVFLSYYLNNKRKLDIANLAQGISVVHLYSSQLALLNLNFPTLTEQTKIASFLTAVDYKLQALKQKKNLLEQYKKGVMQKIFSQELRFKDKNEKDYPNWEEKKLGDIVKEYNVKSIVNDQYVVLSSSMGGIKLQSDYFTKDVSSKDNTGYKIVPKGYFTYRSMSDTGSFTFNIQNIVDIGIVSPAYPVFKTIDSIVSEYLSFYLNNSNKIINDLLGLKEGGTRYALSFSKFSRLEVILPSFKEQTKIANFLSAIDDKINHCQSQIEKTETWKKGLLQQMFC